MQRPWQPLRTSAESGSSPLEIVLLVAILLLPIAPMIALFEELTAAVAAESIAKNALRSAVLDGVSEAEFRAKLESSMVQMTEAWGRSVLETELSCEVCLPGELVTIRVRVGDVWAVQSASLEPA